MDQSRSIITVQFVARRQEIGGKAVAVELLLHWGFWMKIADGHHLPLSSIITVRDDGWMLIIIHH